MGNSTWLPYNAFKKIFFIDTIESRSHRFQGTKRIDLFEEKSVKAKTKNKKNQFGATQEFSVLPGGRQLSLLENWGMDNTNGRLFLEKIVGHIKWWSENGLPNYLS